MTSIYGAAAHSSPDVRTLRINVTRVLPLADAALVIVASVISTCGYEYLTTHTFGDILQATMVGAVFALALCSTAWLKRLYTRKSISRLEVHIMTLLAIWMGIVAALSFAAFCLKIGHAFSRGSTLSFIVITPVLLVSLRLFGIAVRSRFGASWLIDNPPSVVVALSRTPDHKMIRTLADDYGDTIRALVTISANEDIEYFAQRICQQLRGSDVEQILLVTDETINRSELRRAVTALDAIPLPVFLFPDPDLYELIAPSDRSYPFAPILLRRGRMHGPSQFAKSFFDRSLALMALMILAPIMLVVALAIRLESPGPSLFVQNRRGFNGRPFRIYKFRTMTAQENGATVTQARRNDPRITAIGRVLRRTSIDELPQLINVLMGHMSLVGPRPHALAHDEYYAAAIETYARRHNVKPGLTGWAQINGSRGETPTIEHMERRIELDLWYISHWRFRLDIWILLRTTIEVMRGSNAF
jgi:putative colanic acid biosynthesis UDP-glucose lipid carrier transferase